MKKLTLLIVLMVVALPVFTWRSNAAFIQGKKPPEVITLATEAKLGPVKFSHADHFTKNRNADGQPIACIECHHTAQPASEVAKHPPHKTAWPADRTTTLTADLLDKDSSLKVDLCTDCHARAETKPKLLPEIPTITPEGSSEAVVLTNQQAFHRNCGGCHDAVAKTKETTAPTSKKCLACHKKATTA
jgi:hypothetical protein